MLEGPMLQCAHAWINIVKVKHQQDGCWRTSKTGAMKGDAPAQQVQ
jgi:hypothetical protein